MEPLVITAMSKMRRPTELPRVFLMLVVAFGLQAAPLLAPRPPPLPNPRDYLTIRQRHAFRLYMAATPEMHAYSDIINPQLRGRSTIASPRSVLARSQYVLGQLDAGFARLPAIGRSLTLYRGEFPQRLPIGGVVETRPEFLCCSQKRSAALSFLRANISSGPYPVLAQIEVGAREKAFVSHIWDDPESAVILKRGQKVRVLKVIAPDASKGQSIWVVQHEAVTPGHRRGNSGPSTASVLAPHFLDPGVNFFKRGLYGRELDEVDLELTAYETTLGLTIYQIHRSIPAHSRPWPLLKQAATGPTARAVGTSLLEDIGAFGEGVWGLGRHLLKTPIFSPFDFEDLLLPHRPYRDDFRCGRYGT